MSCYTDTMYLYSLWLFSCFKPNFLDYFASLSGISVERCVHCAFYQFSGQQQQIYI